MKWDISIVLIFCLIAITGCGGALHQNVFLKLHPGDSVDKVIDTLGKPDTFFSRKEGEQQALIWVYQKRADQCVIEVVNNEVYQTACESDAGYKNPLQKVLMAFSEGFNKGMAAPDPIRPAASPALVPTMCNSQVNRFTNTITT